MTKVCYRYDQDTKEYLCTDFAFESPLEPGVFPIPANCTFEEPPVYGEFEVPVFTDKWEIKPDYRKHFESGAYVGGKPYYDPDKFWWDNGTYMTTIGDIPSGMQFTKIDKPEVVLSCAALMTEVDEAHDYLDSTDKNYIELQAYKSGYRKYLTEDAVKELEEIEELRDEIASTIGPKNKQIEELKVTIVNTYGEEALNHIL